jgi:hypothetical protein
MRPKTISLIAVTSLVVLGVVLLFVLRSPAAQAQSAAFQVAQHGHPVGTASFTIAPAPHGYHSTSLVRVNMQGLNYALSKDEQLSQAGHLVQAQVSATVNTSAVELTVRPAGAQVQLDFSTNGHKTTTSLPDHAGAVLLPDFDPGALQTLLNASARQNSRNLWVIVPIKSGSVDPVQMATFEDMQGTLNGKPMTVHHLVATVAGAKTELFSGPQNQLMQAELPQEGFALVRNGFVLKPPAKAPAPPAQPQTTQQPQPQN